MLQDIYDRSAAVCIIDFIPAVLIVPGHTQLRRCSVDSKFVCLSIDSPVSGQILEGQRKCVISILPKDNPADMERIVPAAGGAPAADLRKCSICAGNLKIHIPFIKVSLPNRNHSCTLLIVILSLNRLSRIILHHNFRRCHVNVIAPGHRICVSRVIRIAGADLDSILIIGSSIQRQFLYIFIDKLPLCFPVQVIFRLCRVIPAA